MRLPVVCEGFEGLDLIGIMVDGAIGGDILSGKIYIVVRVVRLILVVTKEEFGFFSTDARDVMPEIAEYLDRFKPAIPDFRRRDIDIGQAAKAEAADQDNRSDK